MPRTPEITRRFQQAQARRVQLTRIAVRREWAKLDDLHLDDSWRQVGPRISLLVTAAQRGSARDAVAYIDAVLAETGQVAPLDARPNPDRLSGVSSDGRPLDSLLYGGVVEANTAAAGGVRHADAFAQGGRWVDMAAWTLVSDAARDGSALGIVGRTRGNIGYTRQLSGGSCARCTVLAGKWYGWNAGFQRHERCDCLHVPVAEADSSGYRVDPNAAYRDGQVRTGLSKARRQALDDGADISKIVNTQRSLRQRSALESIYANAATREDAIAALTDAGYFAP